MMFYHANSCASDLLNFDFCVKADDNYDRAASRSKVPAPDSISLSSDIYKNSLMTPKPESLNCFYMIEPVVIRIVQSQMIS